MLIKSGWCLQVFCIWEETSVSFQLVQRHKDCLLSACFSEHSRVSEFLKPARFFFEANFSGHYQARAGAFVCILVLGGILCHKHLCREAAGFILLSCTCRNNNSVIFFFKRAKCWHWRHLFSCCGRPSPELPEEHNKYLYGLNTCMSWLSASLPSALCSSESRETPGGAGPPLWGPQSEGSEQDVAACDLQTPSFQLLSLHLLCICIYFSAAAIVSSQRWRRRESEKLKIYSKRATNGRGTRAWRQRPHKLHYGFSLNISDFSETFTKSKVQLWLVCVSIEAETLHKVNIPQFWLNLQFFSVSQEKNFVFKWHLGGFQHLFPSLDI